MRAQLRLLSALLLSLAIVPPAMGQQAVRWQSDLETARRLAAQTNRLILIHFWSDTCEPCARMDRDVFSRSDVAAALEANYVPVKINVRHFPVTAQQFRVTNWPTDVVVTTQGNELDRSVGLKTASSYVARLSQVAASARGQPPTAATAMPYSDRRTSEPSQTASRQTYPYNPPPTQGQPAASWEQGSPGTERPETQPNYGWTPPADRGQNIESGRPGTGIPDAASRATDRPDGISGISQTPPRPSVSRSEFSPSATPAGTVRGERPASGNPPLALDGYCAVSLTEKERWVKGNPRFGVIHENRTYLFAGPDEARRFYEEPERYAPAAAGNDVVLLADRGQTAPGRREHGAWFEGRVYLFSSEDSYTKFSQDPSRYASTAAQPAASTARRSETPLDSRDPGVPSGSNRQGQPSSAGAPWGSYPGASSRDPSPPFNGASEPNARRPASWR